MDTAQSQITPLPLRNSQEELRPQPPPLPHGQQNSPIASQHRAGASSKTRIRHPTRSAGVEECASKARSSGHTRAWAVHRSLSPCVPPIGQPNRIGLEVLKWT
eukprot:6640969-Prymnesium_polylepis.1